MERTGGKRTVYPYIPNSEPETQKKMLSEIGVESFEDLITDIPRDVRMKTKMKLPEPCLAEAELKRHVGGILGKNVTSGEKLSFLGAGCYNHHVPAIVDEIINRSEFLTAYAGEPYEDHGRFQVLFEFESMMAELLDLPVCNVPTYDGSQAAGTALRMSCRITGRSKVLVPGNMNPDRKRIVALTGLVDLQDLKTQIDGSVAAVYVENPNYLGCIETQGQEVADLAHAAGALFVVAVDPSTLGVLKPPAQYGADIVCGDIQPLGIHMNYGGGVAGFIATSDERRFIEEYPSRLFGIAPTTQGEWGFGDVAWERTSFADRENAKEFVGTHAALWGIAASVYLAAMGPKGFEDLGRVCLQRTLYAREVLDSLEGVRARRLSSVGFKEFVVDFGGTGKSVRAINEALLAQGIFGGKDLSADFPELGQSALYAITEQVTQKDIDTLVAALRAVTA